MVAGREKVKDYYSFALNRLLCGLNSVRFCKLRLKRNIRRQLDAETTRSVQKIRSVRCRIRAKPNCPVSL